MSTSLSAFAYPSATEPKRYMAWIAGCSAAQTAMSLIQSSTVTARKTCASMTILQRQVLHVVL